MMKIKSKKWNKILGDELKKDYFKDLSSFLDSERSKKNIFPPEDEVFSALNYIDFDDVKVVVIGQDPYHGAGQAHGLAFSVKKDVKVPPSLVNIYKELHADLGIEIPNHGFLESWAKQGVLLLNNCLTVEESKAGSHHKKGWEQFTDRIIKELNEKKEGLVFLLWGAPAQKKAKSVDEKKHYVLKAPHPSPLSAYRGFFGCKHFSKTNEILKSEGKKEIDWAIPAI
jgi:uracil-DNA glycosylase